MFLAFSYSSMESSTYPSLQLPQLLKAAQSQHTLASPPHPGSLPQPCFPSNTTASSKPARAVFNQEQLKTIKDLVNEAKFIVGFGPITADYITNTAGGDRDQKVLNAALNFMRNKLGITEDEIKNEDILATFLPDDTKIPRIYVQLVSHAHANFCLDLVRTLRNPELKVVKFIPKQFRARNRAIEAEAFILRKRTVPPFKTRIEYSDEDLVLTKCLNNHHTFVQHAPSAPHLLAGNVTDPRKIALLIQVSPRRTECIRLASPLMKLWRTSLRMVGMVSMVWKQTS